MSTLRWAVIGFLCAVCLVGAGFTLNTYLQSPVIETAAAAKVQADGSIIAERAPDAQAKPKQRVPNGAKVERVGQFEVQGEGVKFGAETKPCPPVTIDTSLVRLPDGSKRVIVSSPNGQITRAIDIPVETAAPPPEPKVWAAGLSFDPIHQTAGVWLERDLSRFRVGVDLNQTRRSIGAPLAAEARVRIGWTF